MKQGRRRFLKTAGLGLTSIRAGQDLFAANKQEWQTAGKNKPRFNMCGYAAPALNTIRIGFAGLGNRGSAAVKRLLHIEGTRVQALCDLRPEKVNAVKKTLQGTIHEPAVYTNGEEEWKKLCERDDIDVVYIATHWALHTAIAVYAMNHGKHVCVEVPAAKTLEECWALVHASEQNRRHCMMLENNCYGLFELLTLNMAQQGFFGEIIHCEGAYIHDLLEGSFSKEKYWNMWHLRESIGRNGNLYPTHGLGPVAQIMNLNRGDKMDFLVSVSGNDFMMNAFAKKLAAADDFYKPFVDQPYCGNMNTTTIRTNHGKTLMIQHDVTSPRPKSTIQLVSGTRGTALEHPEPSRLAIGNMWAKPETYQEWEQQYMPPIVQKIGPKAKRFGGHGGMDFLMDWRTIDCLRNGLPLDQDVYDAALWSSIAPLSEWSVAHRSQSIDVPDFTAGAWKTNAPVDVSMSKGGNTGILE